MINEVSANDINMSSFEVKEDLHPKFWVDGKINSKIRVRLLDIADDFFKDLSIDWIKPKDVVFTGSLANYNWSRYSDIDLHIIVDYGKVYKRKEFVEDYFDSKKELWSSMHDKLKIYGFPVEIYVEDSEADNPSSGRYSLYKDKWLVEPNDFQDVSLNQDLIKRKAAKLMTELDDLEKKMEKNNADFNTIGRKLLSFSRKLKNMRQEGLNSKKAEMSSGNIIYKVLRRAGYLDRLWKLRNKCYDLEQSISNTEKSKK